MHIHTYTYHFIEVPAFKSLWKTPAGHPCVEIFLSKLVGELFSFLPGKPQSYSITKEEWEAMHNLAEDCSIMLKPADKGSCRPQGLFSRRVQTA